MRFRPLFLVLAFAAVLSACATQRAEVVDATGDPEVAGFVEPGFPFITTTVEAGQMGASFPTRNLAVRCVVLMLGNDTYACFDPDLLRVAALWRDDFLALTTVAQVSYSDPLYKGNEIPRVLGTPIAATGVYPGWQVGEPVFQDPREPGPYAGDIGRGPISPEIGRWRGLHVVGDRAVLVYTAGEADIEEQIAGVEAVGQRGVARTFRIRRTPAALSLVAAEVLGARSSEISGRVATVREAAEDTVTKIGVVGAPSAKIEIADDRYVTVRLPAGAEPGVFRVLLWRGPNTAAAAFDEMLSQPVEMVAPEDGGEPHWPQIVRTTGVVSPDTADFVIDRLPMPVGNPWKRNVRFADIAFFDSGDAALVSIDGDVWTLSGIDDDLDSLEWRRFASGLYEPLGIEVVGGEVYVFGREGIVKLNDTDGDGEADFYENFSNQIVMSGESREFPMSLAKRPGGGFYVAVGGALNAGPKTSPSVTPGFRAGSRHSGSVLEVSPDGSVRPYATGFREPTIGVHPTRRIVTASDQQGNFVPSTPIYLVEDGGFYGVPATAHLPRVPEPDPVLTWIPHAIDRSGYEQIWLTDGALGMERDALVHISYGKPGPFLVLMDTVGSSIQGAVVPFPGRFEIPTQKGAVHPEDGHLYLTGFQIWGSSAEEFSGLSRVRRTELPSTMPTRVRPTARGILLSFDRPLDPETAGDASRYRVKRWNYLRSEQYGSGHFRTSGEPGEESLSIGAAHLSHDRKSVLLAVPRMSAVMQMAVDWDIADAQGRPLKSSAYLTAHAVPELDLAAAGFPPLDWAAAMARAAEAEKVVATAASAELGAELFLQKGCVGCHSVDGTEKVGPTLAGIWGTRRRFEDGSNQRAYDDYIRESLLDPGAHIVRGFEEGMPSYEGVLSEAEIRSLVLYIEALGAGEETDE